MGETAPGSRFGPYHLRRLLGRGGMGEVYEAYDTVKDRVVALKLMSAAVSSDPVFRERMQREAHTAGRLQEPHVVPIHNYGEIDGQLFIDMRFIEGSDVSTLLTRHGPLPPPRAVAIIRQIAAALDAAHAAGVMHRDIKPENILITGDDFAYLVDFGIAAAVTEERLTQTGSAVGTWNYMAPERFRTDEVTYRADIYALACVLYECLTGSPPYWADSLPVLMAAHLYQPIPRPSQERPGIPAAFDEVIALGMAKDPADRYPRAGDLAVAAHQALSTPDQHQAVNILQHSQQATLAGTDLAASPSAPTPTLAPPWPPTFAPLWPPSLAPAPRKRTPWLILGAAALVIVAVLGGLGIWRASLPHHDGVAGSGTKTTTTTTRTTTTIPTVPPERLNAILLGAAEINTIMGTSNMQLGVTSTEMEKTTYTLSNPDCLGALGPRLEPVYAQSGYTAMSNQLLLEPVARPEHFVDESAVTFPSADQAAAFVTSSAAKWKACAGQTVTQTLDSGGTLTWTIGNLVGDAPKITQLSTPASGSKRGAPCQHALSAVSNVVIDIDACAPQISDEGGRIADAMAANATK
jgi:serine/threonine kinase PknH